MHNSSQHPVWAVYDEYRTARLNAKYYTEKLRRTTRSNFLIELLLALSSSSAVAAIWLLQTPVGELAWKVLGPVAAILAVYRPVAKLSDKLKALEQRVTAYRAIEFDLQALVRRINEAKRYDSPLRSQLYAILERKKNFALSYTDTAIDEPLRRHCYDEVNAELPRDLFFVPEG